MFDKTGLKLLLSFAAFVPLSVSPGHVHNVRYVVGGWVRGGRAKNWFPVWLKGGRAGCLFTIKKAAHFLRKILTKYQFNLGQHRVMV